MISLIFGIGLPLGLALFIYAAFRPREIVVNQVLAHVLGTPFEPWRMAMASALQPPDYVVYCLPGSLWVFAATLVSHALMPGTRRLRAWAACMPLLVVESIELLQYLHITDGSFDPNDMVFGAGLWLVAWLVLHRPGRREVVWPVGPAWRIAGIGLVYSIVYLSDMGSPMP